MAKAIRDVYGESLAKYGKDAPEQIGEYVRSMKEALKELN